MNYPFLVHEYLEYNAEHYPDKEALVFREHRITYADLDYQANLFGLSLIELGLKRSGRVIIFMDNSHEVIISLYGILKAGGIFVILNSATKHQKLAYILEDSGAEFIITSVNKQEIISKTFDLLECDIPIIWTGESQEISKLSEITSYSWNSLLNNYIDSEAIGMTIKQKMPILIDKDIAGLIYTSSSTGEAKGVISTHFNIVSAARSIISYLDNIANDRIFNTLPLSFDYGLYQVFMTFIFGGTLILESNYLFLHSILKIIFKERITGFPMVPMMMAMIFKSIDISKYDLSSLRYISSTGAVLPVEHIKKLHKLLPDVKIYSMFGLTECKRVSYLPPADIISKPDSVGKAIPNCEVFIMNEYGKPIKMGETGELVVRGSNVMQGYWNAPILTNKIFRKIFTSDEKFLFTGDYFKMDEEGYLYFLGRKDDMIKSRSERISAREIENIIYQINGVNECVIVSLPDKMIGQSIKAFIIRNKKSNLTLKKVRNYCLENLEPWAVPSKIEFVDSIPRTAHGKIDKKQLK